MDSGDCETEEESAPESSSANEDGTVLTRCVKMLQT